MVLPISRARRVGGLKVLFANRLFVRRGRSLGTTRPPAVTRIPGGLPCSLSSLSALPRLIEGEGEGFLSSDAGAIAGVADKRRLLFEAAAARVADAEGRRTCSVLQCQQVGRRLCGHEDVNKNKPATGETEKCRIGVGRSLGNACYLMMRCVGWGKGKREGETVKDANEQ
jgi:hypothetical protein